MEIVLSTLHLAGPGGVQSYLLTVAPQLERLGHHVTLYADELGEVAELARNRGLRVVGAPDELPREPAVVVAQEAATLLELAEHRPGAARALVVHSADLDLHLPPQVDGLVAAVVVMNDRVAERVRATAAEMEVVRLRQPIDTERYRAVGAMRQPPRRALLLSNYLHGSRRENLAAACEQAGLELIQVGRVGTSRLEPAHELGQVDLVVGQGRSILEAMSCGRAAWVLGQGMGDGWVTAASYPALEADGFAGLGTADIPHAGRLASDLAAYRASMGEVNRGLVAQHHSAAAHAAELSALLARLVPSPTPPTPLEEMARLVRSRYEADMRAAELARDLRRMSAECRRLGEQIDELKATRRYRTAQLLAAPLERMRRVRGGARVKAPRDVFWG